VLISPDGRPHGLELKRRGGVLSEVQADWWRWAEAHGVPFALCDRFEIALATLKIWGALRVEVKPQ
jgi:hypothetical protein